MPFFRTKSVNRSLLEEKMRIVSDLISQLLLKFYVYIQSSQRDPRDRARAGRHAGKSICQRNLSRRQYVFYRITLHWKNK